jgi:hypothetical protein
MSAALACLRHARWLRTDKRYSHQRSRQQHSMADLPQSSSSTSLHSFNSPAAIGSADPEQSAQVGHGGGNIRRASQDGSSASAHKIKVDISLSIPEAPSPAAPAVPTRIGADKKLEYLDGVRGIMCLIVLSDHWLMMGYYDRPTLADPQQASPFFGYPLTRSPLRLFVAGEFAVATFFVLRCLVAPL